MDKVIIKIGRDVSYCQPPGMIYRGGIVISIIVKVGVKIQIVSMVGKGKAAVRNGEEIGRDCKIGPYNLKPGLIIDFIIE